METDQVSEVTNISLLSITSLSGFGVQKDVKQNSCFALNEFLHKNGEKARHSNTCCSPSIRTREAELQGLP